jgi:hypothetical protein
LLDARRELMTAWAQFATRTEPPRMIRLTLGRARRE